MIRKIAIALVVVLAVMAGAGYLGLQYYRLSQLKDQLNSAMGKDAAYAETILKVEQDSSNITFAELFKLCDETVEGRQKLIIDLRGAYPGLNDELKEKLIEFLNKENDFVRAKRRMYSDQMEFSTAYEDYLKYVTGDLPSYEYSTYSDRGTARRTRLVKAADESKQSAEAFLKLFDEAMELEKAAIAVAEDGGIIFKPTFAKFEEPNRKRGDETLRTVTDVAARVAPKG